MKGTHYLIKALLTGTWCIHPAVVTGYAAQVKAILSGTKLEVDAEPENLVIVSYHDDESDSDVQEEVQADMISQIDEPNSVVIIPICGPILKHDSWCEIGMKTRAEQLRQAYANENVSGVILFGDTPGGESQACTVMTEAIAERNKPVLGFIDGMLCSAGMYMFAGCDAIIAGGIDCIIGSIGTMISFADAKGMYEKEGIKFHEIYADASTEKNIEFREALKGEYGPIKANLLNPINKQFTDHVKNSRPTLNQETTLTGKIFLSKDAKANGLIDDIGNLNFAIKQVPMFNSKFKKLESYRHKTNLSAAEAAEVQKILNEAGIPATVKPQSMLLESEGDAPGIYIYAEEGEDPVGKRCVEADAEGQPTETNVKDGDHKLADGRTLTSSTKEDGMSYVDSITEAEQSGEGIDDEKKKKDEEKPDASQEEKPLQLTQKQLDELIEQKVKAATVAGKAPAAGGNGSSQTHKQVYVKNESAFDRRRAEIIAKNKGK